MDWPVAVSEAEYVLRTKGKACLGASAHTLRLTFPTHHVAKGTSLRTVQEAPGPRRSEDHLDLRPASPRGDEQGAPRARAVGIRPQKQGPLPLSECSTEEMLKLIEKNGGAKRLDLSGKDLSGIDLSREALAPELEKARLALAGKDPVWSSFTNTINLSRANLQQTTLIGANLQGASLSEANLEEATDLEGSYFYRTFLDNTRIDKEQLGGAIGEELAAKEAYARLTW